MFSDGRLRGEFCEISDGQFLKNIFSPALSRDTGSCEKTFSEELTKRVADMKNKMQIR